jgi:thymidylate synthase (FAD)
MKINCLDLGFVKCEDTFGDDLKIVNCARVSMNSRSDVFDERDQKLLKYLLTHQHTSPLRHCFLTLHVKCPLFVRDQIVKHRVGSFIGECEINSVSFRYVNAESFDFYTPSNLRKQSPSNKQGSLPEPIEDQDYQLKVYINSVEQSIRAYKSLIEAGVAREVARCLLPTSMYTEFIWTLSLHAVLHFVNLRNHKDAQPEIAEYAEAIGKIVSNQFPTCWHEWQKISQS